MLFTCIGDKENPAVLLMHGMFQNYRSVIERLGSLSEKYYLIVPAMDGTYPDSPVFETFEKEADQIIDYVEKNFDGHLAAVYGISQGTLLLAEVLSRNILKIDTAIFDGTYVAHQGYLSAWCMIFFFLSAKKNGGRMPKIFDQVKKKMGLKEEDYVMLKDEYWDADETSIRNNIKENYIYVVKPSLKDCEVKTYL